MCKKEDNNTKRKYGGCHRSPHDGNEKKLSDYLLNRATIDLPNEFDLLDKYPKEIREQGSQGSCGGFAGAILRQMHTNNINEQLSPAFLYWEARKIRNNETEDSGVYLQDIVQVLQDLGVPKESYMPYDENTWTVPPSIEAYKQAKKYKIDTYFNVDNGIAGIKSYLYSKKKPVLFGMEIYENFVDETKRTGFVPIPKRNEKPIDGHSALIIGYKNNTFKENLVSTFNHKRSKYGYFIVAHSYGKQWSKKTGNLFYLPYEFVLMQKAYDFYVITTSKNYEEEIIDKNK